MRRLRIRRNRRSDEVTPYEAALLAHNEKLQLEITRLKRLYSEARAGLRQATGCEAPSPRARAVVNEVLESQMRRDAIAALAEAESVREASDPVIRDQEGRVLEQREVFITDAEMAQMRQRDLRRAAVWKTVRYTFAMLLLTAMFIGLFLLDSKAIYEWFQSW